jgi:hypothetical protein
LIFHSGLQRANGDEMTVDLDAALQELQEAISANSPAPTVIDIDALETRFHGLTLRQLVMLTQAPVLVAAVFSASLTAPASSSFRLMARMKINASSQAGISS